MREGEETNLCGYWTKNASAGLLQTLHDHQYRHAFKSPVYIHPDGEACTLLQIVTAAIKKWAADKEDEAEQCIIQKLSFAYSDILRDASARMRMAQALETQNKLVHTSPTRATRRLQYNKRPCTGLLLFTFFFLVSRTRHHSCAGHCFTKRSYCNFIRNATIPPGRNKKQRKTKQKATKQNKQHNTNQTQTKNQTPEWKQSSLFLYNIQLK